MKHIFYIYSNLHYTISLQIIKHKKIKIDDIYFVTQRHILIDDIYLKEFVNDKFKSPGLKKRLFNLMFNNFFFSFLDNHIVAYVPFRRLKPFSFFNELVLYEEGVSCYSDISGTPLRIKLLDIFYALIFIFISNLFFWKSKNFKSYLTGEVFFYNKPHFKKKTKYYGLLKNPNLGGIDNIEVNYLEFENRQDNIYDRFQGSNILVMDSLLSENFKLTSIKTTLLDLQKIIKDKIYIQFHPSDMKSPDIKNVQIEMLKDLNLNFEIIDINIDNLIANDLELNVIGFTSSILFYVNKYSTTNKSYSLAKKLFEIDNLYKIFLRQWGGKMFFEKLTNNGVKLI